jgi:hypothetical protein
VSKGDVELPVINLKQKKVKPQKNSLTLTPEEEALINQIENESSSSEAVVEVDEQKRIEMER